MDTYSFNIEYVNNNIAVKTSCQRKVKNYLLYHLCRQTIIFLMENCPTKIACVDRVLRHSPMTHSMRLRLPPLQVLNVVDSSHSYRSVFQEKFSIKLMGWEGNIKNYIPFIASHLIIHSSSKLSELYLQLYGL